jgi:hypothetical protein
MYLHPCIPGGEDLVCARPFRRLPSRRCEYGNTGGCDGGARCSPAPLPCPLPCSLLPCYRHAAQDLARTTTPGTGCVLVMGRPLVWMWGRPARGSVRLESGRRTKDDGLGSFRMRERACAEDTWRDCAASFLYPTAITPPRVSALFCIPFYISSRCVAWTKGWSLDQGLVRAARGLEE